MTALTSKTSSQSFFLRVLKVIIQLREAALLAIKKAKKEAEQQQAKKDAEQKKEAEEKKEEEQSATKDDPSKEGGQQSTAMEVEGSTENKELVDTLESLSVQLTLNSLWDTLSNCLKELAETPDHHAVLVLQPTVEAFFLVHAAVTSSEEKKKPNQKETRKEQLSHIEEKEGQLECEQAPQAVVGSEEDISPDTKKFLAFAETH